jgi:tetratricopeptide (TPR) repeat protein
VLEDILHSLPGDGRQAILAAFGLAGALAVVVMVILARRMRADESPTSDRRIKKLIKRGDYGVAGDLLIHEGDYDKALALFLQSGNTQKAAQCYLALKQPRRAAQLYKELGRWAEAAHHYQAGGAWREAAECLHQIGSEREAAELYERAGELVKAANLLRGLGDHASAARLFERAGLGVEASAALLQARGRTGGALRRAGELLERAGELRRAAECFAEAEEWLRAGALFEEAHAFSLAGQSYEKAEAWERAGPAYERAGALHEARANYERAGDSTRAAQVAVRMGSLLDAARGFYRLGSYERAIESLQQVPDDSPHSRESHILLARIFLEMGLTQRARETLEPIAPASLTSKEDADILCLLAQAHEEAGDLGPAAELLEMVLDGDPTHTRAHERLEELHRRTGGDPGAVEAVRDHRYELQGEIGRGGMGVVHLAHDRELGRPVAVKFLPDNLAENQAALDMFRAEARAAALINHSNVVQVYDVGQVGGRYCMVMEYVPGRTVREMLRRPGSRKRVPLPSRRVAEISREVAMALDYAHRSNVIHRDVKPGNILISETGQVKLMDFGISKVLEQEGDGLTQARGTPQYMPPEQILGRAVDGRTDVYALGISMFEMMTGRRPFQGEGVVDQQLHSALPDPRELNENLPDILIEILQQACQKKPEDRFSSAGEMAEALDVYLTDQLMGTLTDLDPE